MLSCEAAAFCAAEAAETIEPGGRTIQRLQDLRDMDSDYPLRTPQEPALADPDWAVKATVTAADATAPVVDTIEFEISLAGRKIACLTFRNANAAPAPDWDQLINAPNAPDFFRLWLDAPRGAWIASTGGRSPRVVFITGGAKVELPLAACRGALEAVKRECSIIQPRR